jgi:ribokinase
MVETHGAEGGIWWGESEGRWEAVAPDGEPRDAYGCGDSFAAAFTLGLATGASVAEAASIGARAGARCVTRAGAP